MTPLLTQEVHDGVFSDYRFAQPLKLQLDAVESTRQPKKSVRFNRALKFINPEAEYYTDDDVRTKWWATDELAEIRNEAKEMSRTLRRDGECDLTMAHRKTSLMLAADFRALVKLGTETPDQHLKRWCSHDDGRRGLERFASKDYCCLRRRDITNTRTAVIAEQTRQKEMQLPDPEAIAQYAREASRRARSFAVFFGEGDASPAPRIRSHEEILRRAPPRKRSKIQHPLATEFCPASS